MITDWIGLHSVLLPVSIIHQILSLARDWCKRLRLMGFSGFFFPIFENSLRWSFFTFIHNRSSNMNYFIYTSHHFIPHVRYELNKLTSLPMCGFIAQLVERRTGIAEVTGSNPGGALIFSRLLLSNCLNWTIYCDDHSSLSSITAVQIWIISYILHINRYLSGTNAGENTAQAEMLDKPDLISVSLKRNIFCYKCTSFNLTQTGYKPSLLLNNFFSLSQVSSHGTIEIGKSNNKIVSGLYFIR